MTRVPRMPYQPKHEIKLTPQPDRTEDVKSLRGTAFETYVADLLSDSGYIVRSTPSTRDQGADLIAEKGGTRIVIQAKGWKNAVGNKAVQEIVAALKVYNASEAWVVTNSSFTGGAWELAKCNGVRLFGHHDLRKYISAPR